MSDNKNSCATCRHMRADIGDGWCYMFREQPEELCLQHQDRKHLRPPTKLGLALAVLSVITSGTGGNDGR